MVSFAERMGGIKASDIRQLLAVASKPDIISFAGGLPAPELFPWVSCVFVSEEYRGLRISEKLIRHANLYLREAGFDRSYIPSGTARLYERYGYSYVREIRNYGGTWDHLYVKDIR